MYCVDEKRWGVHQNLRWKKKQQQPTHIFKSNILHLLSKMSFACICSGVLLILHSAYSCLHYRGLVKEFTEVAIPPFDVKIEVCLGFLLVLAGQLMSTGPLRTVMGNCRTRILQYKTREFDHYQNRGTAIMRKLKQLQWMDFVVRWILHRHKSWDFSFLRSFKESLTFNSSSLVRS